MLIWEISPRDEFNLTVMRDIRDCMEKKCWKWSWMENGENDGIYHDGGYAMGVPSNITLLPSAPDIRRQDLMRMF